MTGAGGELIDVDYIVFGAGAGAMAFVDTLISEDPDATVAIVDSRAQPGGHWVDAYPFVRLHLPSRFYGVHSRRLGFIIFDLYGASKNSSRGALTRKNMLEQLQF